MGINILTNRPGLLGYFEPSIRTPLGGGAKVVEVDTGDGEDAMIRAAKRAGKPGIVAMENNSCVYIQADRLELSNLPVGRELAVNGQEYYVQFATDGSLPSKSGPEVKLSLKASTGR